MQNVSDTTGCVFSGPEREGLRERKKNQTREAIHAAALELTREHGSAHVTAEQIAERAGVSPRTFFNYWGTKESAIIGFHPEKIRLLADYLRARPASEPISESMRAVAQAFIEHAPVDPDVRQLKREVFRREPHLAQQSMSTTHDIQWQLIDVLHARLVERGLSDDDAWAAASLAVFDAFATLRAVFAVSMHSDVSLAEAQQRVNTLRQQPIE